MRKPKTAPDPRVQWRKASAAAKRTKLEDVLAQQLHALHLPSPKREFVFHPERRWRFDFAWPEFHLAVEVDGGTNESARGRHMRQAGFQNDADKMNAALELGWKVYRYTATRIRSGHACTEIKVALERAAWNRVPE